MFVDPTEANRPPTPSSGRTSTTASHSTTFKRRITKAAKCGSRPSTPRSRTKWAAPVKVVKIATDVTAAVKARTCCVKAVEQAQEVSTAAAQDGDLTQRIPLEGKSGPIAERRAGVNR